jgi:thiosulfate/3-mercaptopyruvate sulfurtransferase
MRRTSITICLTVILLVLGVSMSAQSSPKLRTDMLVSTDWLAEHLNDPNVIVIHFARYEADYSRGHIPGARFLRTNQLISDNQETTFELPPVASLQKALESVGINDKARIVIYGTQAPPTTTRAYFTFDYLGLGDRVALLDGGIEKWKSEKRTLSTEPAKVTPTKLTVHPRAEVVAKYDEVRKITDSSEPTALILDARPMTRYKDGHLAGATDLFWVDTLTSREIPSWKSPEELRKMFETAGFKPGSKIITYCEVGQQATHAYFTARYLGYDVAMYDGSYDEWTSAKDAPVVKGDAKR